MTAIKTTIENFPTFISLLKSEQYFFGESIEFSIKEFGLTYIVKKIRPKIVELEENLYLEKKDYKYIIVIQNLKTDKKWKGKNILTTFLNLLEDYCNKNKIIIEMEAFANMSLFYHLLTKRGWVAVVKSNNKYKQVKSSSVNEYTESFYKKDTRKDMCKLSEEYTKLSEELSEEYTKLGSPSLLYIPDTLLILMFDNKFEEESKYCLIQ
jgi:hypothetical protein